MHVGPFKEQAARRQPRHSSGRTSMVLEPACRRRPAARGRVPLSGGGGGGTESERESRGRTWSLEVLHCRLLVTSSTSPWHRFVSACTCVVVSLVRGNAPLRPNYFLAPANPQAAAANSLLLRGCRTRPRDDSKKAKKRAAAGVVPVACRGLSASRAMSNLLPSQAAARTKHSVEQLSGAISTAR